MTPLKDLKVKLLITFFISLSTITLTANNPFFDKNQSLPVKPKCDEIEVKLEITHTTGNQRNGEIELNFKESSSVNTYTYFVFSGTDTDNRLEVKGNKVSDLAKGNYNLYIQNQAGCTKHMKFKIN